MTKLIFNKEYFKSSAKFLLLGLLAALSGCGDGGTAPSANGAVITAASTIQLSATTTSVPSDNTGSTTITVTTLSATNAALPGIVVSLSTDTGIVSASSITTGSDGTATFTFRSGTASLANRTATISASAGATAQIPIQISGSTLSVFSTTGSSVPNDGTSPVTVTFIAKNAQGLGVASTPYTVSWVTISGGQLILDTTAGTTDSAGKFSVIVKGTGSGTGTATVSATAAGSTASATVTVSAVAGIFGIKETLNSTGSVVTTNPTAVPMKIGDSLTVTVSAPSSGNVTFVTTQGTWVGSGTTSQTVAVAVGEASAVLQQTSAGQANVQVSDPVNPSTLTDNLTVGITAVTPYSITLTASPTIVGKGGGTSTLIAKVLDASNQPVGNAAVSFSMSNTTGGGESISPVVAYTAEISGGVLGLGEASATFTSGSLSSSAAGVQVRATVQGTTVVTNTAPSGNDTAIVIGGTAGSIAFGISTQIVSLNTTTYQLPMSILVADANGNPQASQTVNLSVWPVAWSTGTQTPCAADTDTATTGTFYSEDVNGNLILDAGEDGTRNYYSGGGPVAGGTKDKLITPVNSAAGSLPLSLTTDANGLANFNLTYLKASAIWTKVRIRATTVVQGTEAVSQTIFDLPAAKADAAPTCLLTSPYNF